MSLIPANFLGATYNPFTSVLTLCAEGEVDYSVVGIHFKRDPRWVGGLRFFLQGYPLGEIGPAVVKPYTKCQRFIIPYLKRIDPSGEIIIVTLNHPDGKAVKVRWLGCGDSESADLGSLPTSQLSAAPATSEAAQTPISDVIVIDTVVGKMFTIKEILPRSPSGTLDVDFSPYQYFYGSHFASLNPVAGLTAAPTASLLWRRAFASSDTFSNRSLLFEF